MSKPISKPRPVDAPLSAATWRDRLQVLDKELRQLRGEISAIDAEATGYATEAANGDGRAELKLQNLENRRADRIGQISAKSAILESARQQLNAALAREDAERCAAQQDEAAKLAGEVAALAQEVIFSVGELAATANCYFEKAKALGLTCAEGRDMAHPAHASKILDRLRAVIVQRLGTFAVPGYHNPSRDPVLFGQV